MDELRLVCQYAGRNACHGHRFEKAVEMTAEHHPHLVAELARLRAVDPDADPTPADTDARLAEVERAIRLHVLAAGGYEDGDTVERDICDVSWGVEPHMRE